MMLLMYLMLIITMNNQLNNSRYIITFNSYYLEMFDTLKFIYTQDEALELVSKYEKVYNEKIEELEEENRLLKNEIAWLKDHTKYNSVTEEEYIDWTMTATEANLRLEQARQNQIYVSNLEEENKKLKEENVLLKWCLDKLMFDTDVVNIKIHLELWDYCYVRSDKKFKLNVQD